MMAHPLPSEEIEADFKNALQDLTTSYKPEIDNLTIIAKECIDNAQGLCRVLENHIKTTRPEFKYYALLVLDSIAKNVGNPYTTFLGRNLFNTFMDTYALVNNETRHNMEQMLKSWKDPANNAMDRTRPVFPPQTTGQIETALIRARTAVIEAGRRADGRSMPPGKFPAQLPARPSPSHTPVPVFNGPPPVAPSPNEQPGVDTVRRLVQLARAVQERATRDLIAFPANPEISAKQKAMGDLINLLSNGTIRHPRELKQIEDRLHATLREPELVPTPAPASMSTPAPVSIPPPVSAPAPVPTPPQLFNPQLLAQLIAQVNQGSRPASLPGILAPSASGAPGPGRPPFSSPPAGQPTPSGPSMPGLALPTAPPAASGPADLLASLVRTSLLPQSTQQPGMPLPVASSFPGSLPLPLAVAQPPRGSATPQPVASGPLPSQSIVRVDMTNASVRVPRPHLVALLYDAIPNKCATCGRRFPSTATGKGMKTRHLDWHFRVRDPDIGKRDMHRSWYIDERDWIDFREQDDAAPQQPANEAAGGRRTAKNKDPKEQYVAVPDDPVLARAPCPICQEKFDAIKHAETDEWVWMDAIMKAGRIYHASCYAEMNQDSTRGSRNITPDPVLGKRKRLESGKS